MLFLQFQNNVDKINFILFYEAFNVNNKFIIVIIIISMYFTSYIILMLFSSFMLSHDQHFVLPSLTSFRAPSRDIRNYPPFSLARKKCPSAGCATAANFIYNYTDILSAEINTLKHTLR